MTLSFKREALDKQMRKTSFHWSKKRIASPNVCSVELATLIHPGEGNLRDCHIMLMKEKMIQTFPGAW